MAAGINVRGFAPDIEQQDPTFRDMDIRPDEVTRDYNECLADCGRTLESRYVVTEVISTPHGRYHDCEYCVSKIETVCGACQKGLTESQMKNQQYRLDQRLGYIHRGCEELANKIKQFVGHDPDHHHELKGENLIQQNPGADYILRKPVIQNGALGNFIKPGVKIENHQKKHATNWIGRPSNRPEGTTFFPKSWDVNDYITVFNAIVDSPTLQEFIGKVPLRGDREARQLTVIVDLKDTNSLSFKYTQNGAQGDFHCKAVEVQAAYGGHNADGQFYWNIHMYPHEEGRG